MTHEQSLVLRVVEALTANAIPCLLAGSFASNFHGIPRSTQDADFVVQLTGGLGREFATRLGEEFDLDPQLSFETVTGTFRQYLRHRHSAFKIALFMLSAGPHDQERFARRCEVSLFGRRICLLTAEDVVICKLRWGRLKDVEDVRNVMAVQRGHLDWPYIERWCRTHGTLARLEEIRRGVPEI